MARLKVENRELRRELEASRQFDQGPGGHEVLRVADPGGRLGD